MDKSTLHPPPFLSPLARRLLILAPFLCLALLLLANKRSQIVPSCCLFLCPPPPVNHLHPHSPGWGVMINYSGASCAPFFFFNLNLLESLSYLAYARSPHCLESAGDSRRETGCTIKRGKCKSFSARTSKRF